MYRSEMHMSENYDENICTVSIIRTVFSFKQQNII